MKPSAWLVEFHRQWRKARAGSVTAALRPFRRDWETLLDQAGIHSAEDREAAQREAEKCAKLKLIPVKYRPRFIDKIELPLASEAWLHDLFHSVPGETLQRRSLDLVRQMTQRSHPLWPELWNTLGERLESAFAEGRSAGPFAWKEPDQLETLLAILFELTARPWRPGTLIRDASTALGRDSKSLESLERPLTRALEFLFGEETPLEALGIQTRNSVLHFSGPLELHFEDGPSYQTDLLRFESTLPVAEIERAVRITTNAQRLLTVENSKTTFLQLARADQSRSTLLVATSFPTQAVRRLLEKLPPELPHFHFGDTDPSGWDILRRLREIHPRPVRPFQMAWRTKEDAPSLTPRDQQILTRLLVDPMMADCREPLEAMREAGTKGDYEQESLGPPQLEGWSFFEKVRL
jgi:hypothetical protein